MELNGSVLKSSERTAYLLRSLYRQFGYRQYRMSKFEEYDFYAANRDFLFSNDIITFTDRNGRLMALKPDVTLSIVKSTKDAPGTTDKVYYNENVYRVPRGANAFRELLQVGLECIGDIDDYNIFETVLLAAKSLALISSERALTVSHLGIIDRLLDDMALEGGDRRTALKLIEGKNMHELGKLLEKSCRISDTAVNSEKASEVTDTIKERTRSAESFMRILRQTGSPADVLRVLEEEGCDPESISELRSLFRLLRAAGEEDHIVLDLSAVSDMSYYNGIVFRGYISGVPGSVLIGGQYDRLLKKLGRRSRAIGFAVYMDLLEMYFENDSVTDIDAVIKYDSSTDRNILYSAVAGLAAQGISCTAQREIPSKLRFRTAYAIDEEGVLRVISGKEAAHA